MKNIIKGKCSIIIRTKNEERWIGLCLDSIFKQTYKNFEIIIVDNFSTDQTLKKIKKYKIKKIINIKKYYPGKSLNLGINNSNGEFITFISAHCIPVNNKWLANLVKTISESNNYAGVYGRQQPMKFSPYIDQRDLLITFGLDKKIQIKDSFFHNANSIIRRIVWQKIKFDEKTSNIEDRIWAKKIIKLKMNIVYQPSAGVFHYHGIHQNSNTDRLKNVVNVIEANNLQIKGKININSLKILAIIPIRGKSLTINNTPLIKFSINFLKKSKYLSRIIVSTDNKYTMNLVKKMGVEAPFIRPKKLSKHNVNLDQIQKFSLAKIEQKNYFPDLIVHLEETFPFRSPKLIDHMIETLIDRGYDSIIASKYEPGWVWKEKDKYFYRIDSGDKPRELKEKFLVGLHGLGCVTYPEFLRKGNILGEKIGLYETNNFLSNIEIRTINDYKKIFKVLKNYFYKYE